MSRDASSSARLRASSTAALRTSSASASRRASFGSISRSSLRRSSRPPAFRCRHRLLVEGRQVFAGDRRGQPLDRRVQRRSFDPSSRRRLAFVERGELGFQLLDRRVGLVMGFGRRRDVRLERDDAVGLERLPFVAPRRRRMRLRRRLFEAGGMIAKPQRNLVQHVVVRPRRVVVDQPRDLGVEEADDRAGAVFRRAIAARPQIGKERILVVGFALLVAVGSRPGSPSRPRRPPSPRPR